MRTRSRIFGGQIDRVCKDINQLHDDVEQVISVHHAEFAGSMLETHLKEDDAHLYSLPKHGEVVKNVVPLTALSVGDESEIVELRGGRGMLQRLTDMGFTLSTKVKVLASCPSGPVLLEVRDARIALGRGVAARIMVRKK